jgi:hypothetical protein
LFEALTETLGYSRTVTLLLCAPPWGFATIVAFLCARHSDYQRERFYHIAVPLVFGLVGFIIAASTLNIAARYIALYAHSVHANFSSLTLVRFLMAQSYAGFIVFLAWISNTFVRPRKSTLSPPSQETNLFTTYTASKRAVALAFINAFSQLGNIAGS